MKKLLGIALAAFIVGCAEPNINSTGRGPTPVPLPDSTQLVSLRAADGRYVTAVIDLQGDDKEILIARSDYIGEWEQYTAVLHKDGKVTLRAVNSMYVSCDGDKSNVLVANRSAVGDWERFTIVPINGDTVALKAWNGLFVAADFAIEGTRHGALFGKSAELKASEKFTLDTIVAAMP